MYYCNKYLDVYQTVLYSTHTTSSTRRVLSIIQTRQLNLWGFTRLTRCGSWSHEDFIRGNTERLDRIQRVEIKSTAGVATDVKSKPKKVAQQRKSARPTRKSSRKVRASSPDDSLHTADGSLPTQEVVVSPSPQNAANVTGIPTAGIVMPMPLLSQMVWPAASSSNYAITANASYQQVSYPVVSSTNSMDGSQLFQQGYPSSSIQYQQQTTDILGHSMVNSGYQPQRSLQRRDITSQSNHVMQQQYTGHQQQLPLSNVTTTNDNNDNSIANEDLLFLLSGIFEPEVNGPSSTDADDLCSILSLNDMSGDFMDPISFY